MIVIMSDAWSPAFAAAPERRLPRGATLFHRGDPVRHLFHLREGHVALRRALSDGGALTLHVAGPGDMAAPASLWADAPIATRPAKGMRASPCVRHPPCATGWGAHRPRQPWPRPRATCRYRAPASKFCVCAS